MKFLLISSLAFAGFWRSLHIGIGPDGRQYIDGDLEEICDMFKGNEAENQQIQKATYNHLEHSLRLLNNPQIGTVTTEDLLDEAKDVQFCQWLATTPMGGNDSRAGAINDDGIVVTNRSVLMWMPNKIRDILLIHELIEAAGVYDDNYDITTLLAAPLILEDKPLTQNKQALWATVRELLQPHLLDQKSTLNREYPLMLAGGVTGVGSGGDPLVVAFKAYHFAKALTLTSKTDSLKLIQTMRVTLDEPLMAAAAVAAATGSSGISLPSPDSPWVHERITTNDWVTIRSHSPFLQVQVNAAKYFLLLLTGLFKPTFIYDQLFDPTYFLNLGQ